MQREWLERELAAGRSIEAIARELWRDPSTVAYWVNKHGLTSQHAPKHAARGGLVEGPLRAMVERGLSVRQIAAASGVSATSPPTGSPQSGARTAIPESEAEALARRLKGTVPV